MTGLITALARLIALKKHASRLQTGFLPLGKIRKAMVFIDALDPDSEKLAAEIKAYFGSKGIEAMVLAPSKKEINCFGWVKKKLGKSCRDFGEDLFISLAASSCFASEYAARCSQAPFKVGHEQLEGGIFDLVVCDPENSSSNQTELFKSIKNYLEIVR